MATWREPKREKNKKKHKVDLALASQIEWEAALVQEDRTEDHNEYRFRAIAPIGDTLYVYIFTENPDGSEHAISLREAEPAEKRYYVENI